VDGNEQCSSNGKEAPPPKQTNCNSVAKVIKSDDTFLRHGRFFLPNDQILNVAPQPECLICCYKLSHSALALAELQRQFEANHPAYVTQTISFYKHMKSSMRKQTDSFLGAAKTDQDLLTISTVAS